MNTDRTTLAANVRRWLDRSLLPNAPVPKRILNTQEGEMDIRGKWTPFTATMIYDKGTTSFVWKARFNIIPGMWLIAEDGHDHKRKWGLGSTTR
ncbi:MAG: hypothetical protein KAS36_05250 [Anaerolineales bacterium]|nr:hypothetical protein [Anaerolineales bacterium]